ncbi:MAG: hypothetical protein ACLT4F_08955 [Clostridia bacterium]|jgi:hypothetical protein
MKIKFNLDENFNLNSEEIKKRALKLDSKINKIFFLIPLWLLTALIIIYFAILGKPVNSNNKTLAVIFIVSLLLYLIFIFCYCNDWYNYTHCMLECDFIKNLLSSTEDDGFVYTDNIIIRYRDCKNQLYIGKFDNNGVLKYSSDKISINKLYEHDKDYWLIKGYLNDKGLYQFDTYKPVNISS